MRGVSARRVGHGGERGFALLEILVAFVILALGLGAILTGIAVAVRSDDRTQARRLALRIAQSRLEAAGITEPLLPGYREGQVAHRYRWRETITPVRVGTERPEPRGVKPGPTTPDPGITPFWVEIVVQAPGGIISSVSGLKLAPELRQ